MRKATTRLGRLAAAAGLAVTLGFAPAAFADEIVALKNALYGAGYEVTNVSPQMDDSTRAALTQFQKDNGLQASGILDEDTKKALGMISVQVAASSTTSSAGGGQSGAAAESSAPAADTAASSGAEDGAIEEDEDGGWSLW
ncbi:peptidoglycan-binding domain-containing protein [Marinobacter sp.]|uniref:peptidoglycan-binding domain-containing protein n=1 Tax=Marinobacter sp. TaxID=50741 RepID=UPI0035C70699